MFQLRRELLPHHGLVYKLVYSQRQDDNMETYIEVGAYEAKSHFPEILRKAKSGMAFRITNRGEHVADLVPPGAADKRGGAQAAERMRRFAQSHAPLAGIDIKGLIEEGRD